MHGLLKIIMGKRSNSGRNKNEKASFYNSKYGSGEERLHNYKEKLLEFLPERKSVILDVGCGSGVFSQRMSNLGHTVKGIDISKEAIMKYKKRGLEGYVVDIDKGFGLKDNSFDIVWCSDLIEHIYSPEFLIKEIRRVLKKGGVLLLSTPNSAYFIFRILHLLGKTCSEIQHPLHLHFFSKKSLKKLIEKSGFEVQRYIGRNTPIIFPKSFINPLIKIMPVKEKTVINLLKRLNFIVSDTLTRGSIVHFSYFSGLFMSLLGDEFLFRAKKL